MIRRSDALFDIGLYKDIFWGTLHGRATETVLGLLDPATRALAGEDFERVERELHERFVVAEREVLERLDVDVPSVEIGKRRYHPQRSPHILL